MLIKDIGLLIKERRKMLGINQALLAELSEISVNTLVNLEKGKNNPSFEILSKITGILGMEIKLEVKKTSF